ncbi:MFS-type transporter SLC18B1-like isoform X2 [Cimex lectularius]|uniref:Major facilitator superfamily (MFS) profile domain-containing protein n=1 Tax=Cimex lectularius TaxID=79782 RepID=A0A8I6RAF7_CIMLE|nr:MFS-type transporter SLC18B1-like isoform X2 [Cimex lectularius]
MEAWKRSVKEKKKEKLTKKQWLTLIAIGSVHFCGAICISLQAPFYPQEAEKKNATATEYGLVFGSFEFIAFFSSPFLGKYINYIGVKTTLNAGMLLAAASTISFGLLDMVESHDAFIGLSFFLRMAESLGSTAALVSAFSITAAVFPDSIATAFASLEVFYGVGYIVGPTLGGLFFSWGGYKLPFIVMGIAMIFGNIFVFLVLPPVENNVSDIRQVSTKGVLRVPGVILDSLTVVCTAISMGFIAATLEPHIRIFELSPISNGLMFVISGGTYAIFAPIVGRICDHWVYPKRVLSFGAIFIVFSYVLIGPLPFVGIPKTLAVCITGLVIHGLALSALMVPTFMDSICSAVAAGFPDDLSTYGIISGLWSSSFALGAFIGPSISGYLFDLVGFQYGSIFVMVVHFALFIGITIFISMEKKKQIVPPKRVRLLSHVPGSSSEEEYLNPKLTDTWEAKITSDCKTYRGAGKPVEQARLTISQEDLEKTAKTLNESLNV